MIPISIALLLHVSLILVSLLCCMFELKVFYHLLSYKALMFISHINFDNLVECVFGRVCTELSNQEC